MEASITAIKKIEILTANITTLGVDALVNAANSELLRGGGVDGAIHNAAGPRLQEACLRIGGCPPGQARMTPGFDLLARCVIHTVGPVWLGGQADEVTTLTSCYRESLLLADKLGARSLAFPSISTGVFGFPMREAAKIALATSIDVLQQTDNVRRILFCCFRPEEQDMYEKTFHTFYARSA